MMPALRAVYGHTIDTVVNDVANTSFTTFAYYFLQHLLKVLVSVS